ncbi:L-serine ammonia-lyase, iron-sulfur-dependent subunit beta [Melghirimyces algeriensis]|uniref:L-serine deaminase n=1 Tax=Melghirimyces algeriensis TaxID=910412 RepID=A0A521BHU1_9BACL|nr:L-serine ammonia-lyase, iron-sulfur-dependent subunit beta [Melghirimyces algeriensis]SMO46609.1 L-serine dehydratase [Melghirimyces algeriensis]
MKYRSVFDIIGPVMIGPSSSHTAGAARIGRAARSLFGRKPKRVTVTFYGSFAKTYRGHGTDIAIIGGILDFDTHDERIVRSLEIARDEGMDVTFIESEEVPDHPNTARIHLEDDAGEIEVVGISIGGGKMEIVELNGFELKLSGNSPALLVTHHDRYGAVAKVASVLADQRINIGYMQVSRKEKGSEALMIIETDQSMNAELLEELTQLPDITGVTAL